MHDWLRSWIAWDGSPRDRLDSLPGVMWHLSDAWARRDAPNIVLVHFDDLAGDLEGVMRRLADQLAIAVAEDRWGRLVHAARFEQMRDRADLVTPDPGGVLKDPARFFRRGTSGEGRAVLTPGEVARYRTRVAGMGPPALGAWLHRWPV